MKKNVEDIINFIDEIVPKLTDDEFRFLKIALDNEYTIRQTNKQKELLKEIISPLVSAVDRLADMVDSSTAIECSSEKLG